MNATHCFGDDDDEEREFVVDWKFPRLLELHVDKGHGVSCDWRFWMLHSARSQFNVSLTIFRLASFLHGTANFSFEFVELSEVYRRTENNQWRSVYIPKQSTSVTVSSKSLEHGNVTIVKPLWFKARIVATECSVAYSVSMLVEVDWESSLKGLPHVYLTNTTGHIMSPPNYRIYGSDVDVGEYVVIVSNEESVFITFPDFFLQPSFTNRDCDRSMLQLMALATGETWTFCGPPRRLHPLVIASSVRILSVLTGSGNRLLGTFKLTFTVIPRLKEPEMVAVGLFNCSVPYFDLFKAPLRCNVWVECVGKEDEKDCTDYQSAECGEGMIDDGTKCYSVVSSSGKLSWVEASYKCTEKGLRLVTLPTQEDYASLVRVMSRVRTRSVYVGARQSQIQESLLYRHVWRWTNRRTAFGIHMSLGFFYAIYVSPELCAFLDIDLYGTENTLNYREYCYNCFTSYESKDDTHYTIVCESDKPSKQLENNTKEIRIQNVALHTWNQSMARCPDGHVTRDFLSCDVKSQCGASHDQQTCAVGLFQVPMFACDDSRRSLHFTLVCDHVLHCPDGSDEDFCQYPPCPLTSFTCRNRQCCSTYKVCDGVNDCFDSTDEDCPRSGATFYNFPSTGKVEMDGSGQYTIEELGNSTDCPDTHFLCPVGHCLPVFLCCNDIDDCPGGEDEAECEDYVCPGFYRCLGSKVCLHPDHVCDKVWQCPQFDDEMLCGSSSCPDVCRCQGLAFVCSRRFNTTTFHDLRLLDASGSDMTLEDLGDNPFLIHLNMSQCDINNITYLAIPNLRILDLSWNRIPYIQVQLFRGLKKLINLILSNNPIAEVANNNVTLTADLSLHTLDLSNTSIRQYNGSLSLFHNVKSINLSNSKLSIISDEGFSSTPSLFTLDVRGCPLETFPVGMLKVLHDLKSVYASDYKLCCQSVLPKNFDPKNCYTRQDAVSSCENLIKSNLYRVFVSVFAVLATTGNIGSTVYRVLQDHDGNSVGSLSVFVTNLALADFFMGVYLCMTAAADLAYRGAFLFHENEWKNSPVCIAAGFVSVLSNQVSVFTIFLAVLDRVLVTLFPFSAFRFQKHSALVTCVVMWLVGSSLAVIPVLRVESLQFSDPTAMCVPLPLSATGQFDAFKALILLNLALYTVVACSMVVTYQSARSITVQMASKDRITTETTVFHRLTSVVISDLICWLFMGLVGITACAGVHVPDEVNVATVMFVLPVNSAINPFLYTYSVVAEKRRKTQEERLLKRLKSALKAGRQTNQTHNVSRTEMRASALAQANLWIRNKVISGRDIVSCTRDLA